MKVAIQGQRASYHDQAARKHFGSDIEIVELRTFKDVFDQIADGKVDYGLVAIENSIHGSINPVYDLLRQHNFWICGEVYLHVSFVLGSVSGARKEDIKEVYSHFAALSECKEYLEHDLAAAELIEHTDTAGAARDVRSWNDTSKAAIASESAIKEYGLEIIESGIETNEHNYTRFIALQTKKTNGDDATKTSIILTTDTDQTPGALYKALGVFAGNNINLTKLESRPIVGKAWHYLFYLDFEGGIQDEIVKKAFSDLEAQGVKIEVLGSYKAGEKPA